MAQDFTYPRVAGDYYVQAIQQVYPGLRDGVDFSVRRDAPGGNYTIEDTTYGTYIDQAKVMEIANILIARDPYSGYTPPDPPTLTSLSPSSVTAATDTPVTLTGTNFTPDSLVRADAVVIANRTVDSNTSITAHTGTGLVAGSHAITVQTPGGTSGPQTLTVT